MAKAIACGDIVAGCAFKAEAQTEEELVKKVAAHAKDAHGLNQVTPDLLAKVKAAIVSK
jgi:predicted small metal-binding protein